MTTLNVFLGYVNEMSQHNTVSASWYLGLQLERYYQLGTI